MAFKIRFIVLLATQRLKFCQKHYYCFNCFPCSASLLFMCLICILLSTMKDESKQIGGFAR